MRFSVVSDVRAYWEALRNGRDVPLRSDVNPRGIERALEFAFILERVAPRVARFRLAGNHLNELMGMEVRGMPVTSFFAPSCRHEIAGILDGLFQGPELAELSLAAEHGIGRPPLHARMLLLPLRSDLGDVTRALGCLVSDGKPGRAPRRFDLIGANRAAVSPGTAPVTAAVPPVAGFADPARVFDSSGQTAPANRRAHLRLVRSDD